MWIICKVGFFNIVCQDDDAKKGILSIKARNRKDLERLSEYVPLKEIQESDITDYRFRAKANRVQTINAIISLVGEIDYPKTKPELHKNNPDREDIYLNVWGDLLRIQTRDET